MKNCIKLIAWALALISSGQVMAQNKNPEYTGVGERITVVGSRQDGLQVQPQALVPMASATKHSVFGLVSEDMGMTCGFEVGKGSANRVYLVRAIGPSLETLGITGGAAHPVITIHRNGEEFTKVGYWANLVPMVSSVVSDMRRVEEMAGAGISLEVGKFDSAAVVSLPEGTYTVSVTTATVDGLKTAGGKVLLQLLELPALAVANRAPAIPMLMNMYGEGSLSVRAGRELAIGVSSSDADGDDIDYMVDWDDDGISDQIVRGRRAGTTVVTATWSSPGERYIRVSAKDTRSAYSGGVGSYAIGIRIKIRVTSIEE